MSTFMIDEKAWNKQTSDITSILAALAYVLDGQNKLMEEATELRRMTAELRTVVEEVKEIVDPGDDKGGDQLGETLAKLLAVASANNSMLQQLVKPRSP